MRALGRVMEEFDCKEMETLPAMEHLVSTYPDAVRTRLVDTGLAMVHHNGVVDVATGHAMDAVAIFRAVSTEVASRARLRRGMRAWKAYDEWFLVPRA